VFQLCLWLAKSFLKKSVRAKYFQLGLINLRTRAFRVENGALLKELAELVLEHLLSVLFHVALFEANEVVHELTWKHLLLHIHPVIFSDKRLKLSFILDDIVKAFFHRKHIACDLPSSLLDGILDALGVLVIDLQVVLKAAYIL